MSATLADIDKYPVLKSLGITSAEELAAFQADWEYADKRAEDVIWDNAAHVSKNNHQPREFRSSSKEANTPKKQSPSDSSATQSKIKKTPKATRENSRKLAESYIESSGRPKTSAFGKVFSFFAQVAFAFFFLKGMKRIFGRRTVNGFCATLLICLFLQRFFNWLFRASEKNEC